MIKFIIGICIVLTCQYAYADFTVYYEKASKEILFIVGDKEGRVRISEDDTDKIITKKFTGRIIDHDLIEAYTDYKLVGRNFVVNTKKISDRFNAEAEAEAKSIQKIADQGLAKIKLMGLGLTESEFLSLVE